jgi:AraC family transcriptional regulator of adaptative response/methylated-DNA-[protein]-cysteine methyltransferase
MTRPAGHGTGAHSGGGRGGLARKAQAYLDAHPTERVTLDALADELGVSASHLQRTFKRALGMSPAEYARMKRHQQFKSAMRNGRTVSEATFEAGFGSSSRAYESASGALGMTPATYRKGGEGMEIRYAITSSPIGMILVAWTDRGLCSVRVGDTRSAVIASLRAEFPNGSLAQADGLSPFAEAMLEHVTGARPEIDLPLDIRATAFQLRVWRALRQIPYGETRSYSEVAESIGAPRAARAVARACATNPVALAIPCHRVVRNDGSLGGYGFGVERKEVLLATERRAAGELAAASAKRSAKKSR